MNITNFLSSSSSLLPLLFSHSFSVLQTISWTWAYFVVWFTYFNDEIIYNESTDCNKLLSQTSAFFLSFVRSFVFFFGSYQLSGSKCADPIYRTSTVMYSTIARELSSFCFILNIYYENFLKLLCFCLWAPFSTVCFIFFYVHYSVLFLVCFFPAQSSSVPIFPILPLMSPQFLLNFVWEFWCACTHVFHPIYDSIFLLDILPKYSNWIHRRNAKRASARAHKAHPECGAHRVAENANYEK